MHLNAEPQPVPVRFPRRLHSSKRGQVAAYPRRHADGVLSPPCRLVFPKSTYEIRTGRAFPLSCAHQLDSVDRPMAITKYIAVVLPTFLSPCNTLDAVNTTQPEPIGSGLPSF